VCAVGLLPLAYIFTSICLVPWLGGLVRSEAKRVANRENGRKGGLVKSRKKKIAARRNARRPRSGRRKKSSKL
jgi:hypothetical protein